MGLNIDLSPEMEDCLRDQAAKHGLRIGEYVTRLLERELPTKATTASGLLALPPEQRGRVLAAAAENAAPLYEADLALPPAERELTAFTILDDEDFDDGDA